MIATHEFVVPKSMPTMSARAADDAWKDRDDARTARPSALELARSILRDRLGPHAQNHRSFLDR